MRGVVPIRKDWTILVYQAGDSNVCQSSLAQLIQLQRVGSDDRVELVCRHQRRPWLREDWLGQDREFLGSHTFALGPKDGSAHANFWTARPDQVKALRGTPEPVPQDLGADLRQFLVDSIQRYPARHYALVLTGHGAGLGGQLVTPEGRLSNEELAESLRQVRAQTGQGLDVLSLDTCYGGGLETLYPLRQAARTLVASQGPVAFAAQPLGAIARRLQQESQASPEELARLFVEETARQPLSGLKTPTMAAWKADELDKVAQALAALHERLLARPDAAAVLTEALQACQKQSYAHLPHQRWVYDLDSLATHLEGQADLQPSCQTLRAALAKARLAETHAQPGSRPLLEELLAVPFWPDQEGTQGCRGMSVFYDVTGEMPQSATQATPLSQLLHTREVQTRLGADWSPGPWQRMTRQCQQWRTRLERRLLLPGALPAASLALAGLAGGALALAGLPLGAALAVPALAVTAGLLPVARVVARRVGRETSDANTHRGENQP